MSGGSFTQVELEFFVLLAPVARREDLLAAVGHGTPNTLRRQLMRVDVPRELLCRRGQPHSREAVAEALRRMQAREVVPPHLGLWAQESGPRFANRRRAWTAGDDEVLRDGVGYESLTTIATRLRRSVRSVRVRVLRLGLSYQAYGNRCEALALRLHISGRTLRWYCHCGLLRSWREGGWRIVHSEDAQWLLENYRYYETPWHELKQERSCA